MEIVIKIDDERYKDIQRIAEVQLDRGRFQTAEQVIANGIPLPKGHGDLKDMDDIYEALEGWNDDTSWIVDAIDFQTPTIIEAESEEKNE